jgi:acyl-CoA synthetase (AMP-forming)/AMP-acid ligase II
MEAFATILADTHAKYLLTSGSTGKPKVVINTHRMLCANQQMMAQTWRFLAQEKPVLVDWLPWSHTFGANHNLHMVLCHGGALYIDEGRPAPGLIEKTVRNLREVKPTLLFNVPRGFDMLLPFLEADDALATEVFSRLRLAFYAAAALAPSTWQRLEAVAQARAAHAPAVAHHFVGRDRDLARHHLGALAARRRRLHRCAAAGARAQVRAQRAEAGDAGQGRLGVPRLPRCAT